MFYYISFLRPPPSRASATPTNPILITPQISNDLRTEYLDGPIDIYYAWSLYVPLLASSPVVTKLVKLTSWNAGSAYKMIPVPRPPSIDHLHSKWNSKAPGPGADGPSWRLILACGTTLHDQTILLGATDTTGSTPFAVMSMPVTFPFPRQHYAIATGKKNATQDGGPKQEQITRSYVLCAPVIDRPVVFDITEQTSFDLDKKIWDSGIGLSSWLVRLFSEKGTEGVTTPQQSDLRESLFNADARHILELGAGTGIVAITLAILRSTLDLSDEPGSIVTTDLRACALILHPLSRPYMPRSPLSSSPTASAMPILRDNIAANRTFMSKCVPQAAVLDWEQEQLPSCVQTQLEAGLDVIVMADITYNTASFPALLGTLARLIQLSKRRKDGRRAPWVLMGYKERHPDERSLWDHATDVDLHFRQISQVDGAGGNPVEIWLA